MSRRTPAARWTAPSAFFVTVLLIILAVSRPGSLRSLLLRLPLISPVVWWIALGVCFLALAVLIVRVFPTYLVDRTIVSKKMQQPTTAEYLKAENDIRATLLQTLGALVLLLGA